MRRLTCTVLLVLAGLLGVTPAAFAHNTLVGSDPVDGASMESGPAKVTLTFDQPVQDGFNTVTVTGRGNTRWESGEVDVKGNVVTAGVRPLGEAGEYTVHYRVLSADGHPVTGSLKINLTQPGTGTPTTPSGVESTYTTDPVPTGGMPVWPWLVGAAVLLIGGVALALRTGMKEK